MEKYRHKEDCTIMRGLKEFPGKVILFDNEGEEVFALPETWTDDQVWTALRLQNRAYDVGVCVGRTRKLNEIKAALEIAG